MPNIVECPSEDCDGAFDAVEASFGFTNTREGIQDIACPSCRRTWKQLHRLVEPQKDSSFERGFNGDILRDDEAEQQPAEVAR